MRLALRTLFASLLTLVSSCCPEPPERCYTPKEWQVYACSTFPEQSGSGQQCASLEEIHQACPRSRSRKTPRH
jgi:hypothetical protein